MASITESIDVDVDVTTAYNQWTQFETFPQFLSFVESIRQLDDETLEWKVNINGAEREFTARISEQEPDERIAWTSVAGEAKHAGVVTFHRLDDNRSRVTVQLDWEPEGFVENVGAAFGIDDRAISRSARARFRGSPTSTRRPGRCPCGPCRCPRDRRARVTARSQMEAKSVSIT